MDSASTATGAYGGGKAGVSFDPIQFVQRPQVILRAVCLIFAIIVFGCISSQGYYYVPLLKKDVCLYNRDNNACNYGTGIGVIAFLASILFIVGEFMFEQMSSVKTRKHYVLADLGFSGFWAFLYFVGFCYLTSAWSNTISVPPGSNVNNVQAAIAFSFFSIFTWAGCAWFAYKRFRQGTDQAFAPSYEADPANVAGVPGGYTSYPGAADPEGGYHDPPFSQSGQEQKSAGGQFQPPAY